MLVCHWPIFFLHNSILLVFADDFGLKLVSVYMNFSAGWLLICRLSQAVRLDAQGALRYAQLTPFDTGLYWCFR